MNADYNIEEKVIIFLDSLGLSRKRIKQLSSICGNFENLFYRATDYVAEISSLLGDYNYDLIKNRLTEENINGVINYLDNKNILAITYLNASFPTDLKNIDDSPVIIYAKGDINLLNSKHKLGIVGTRKPTRYGREMAELFVKEIAKANIVTISGLAYGIDTLVAENTLSVNGKTIAVLGGGLEEIYPSTNTNLANAIINNGGLIISEYYPSVRPTQYTFPERNRIISGLSKGLLIIEAGEKSGSLITANFALEQGKDLFIIPANVNAIQSMGSNRLIYEMPQSMVIEPQNIIDYFGINSCSNLKTTKELQLTINEQMVYDLLMADDKSFDDLLINTKLKPNELNTLLTEMEMQGTIKHLNGNYYGI